MRIIAAAVKRRTIQQGGMHKRSVLTYPFMSTNLILKINFDN